MGLAAAGLVVVVRTSRRPHCRRCAICAAGAARTAERPLGANPAPLASPRPHRHGHRRVHAVVLLLRRPSLQRAAGLVLGPHAPPNVHLLRRLAQPARAVAPAPAGIEQVIERLAVDLPPPARRNCICGMLNRMVQYNETRLDASFAALSDATRRGVLEQLGRAEASISQLAGKFHMTLTGMKKHIGVLERAALVTTEKAGRVRTCRLGVRALEEEATWIEGHRELWSARFDALDEIVEQLKSKEKAAARRTKR